MIRVLQVVGALKIGGAETMLMNLYRQIDRDSVQFDFLVYNEEETPYTDLVRKLGGRIFYINEKYVRNPILYYYKIKEICEKYGPFAAIHAHMDSHNAIPITFARFLKIPIRISHSHTTIRKVQKGLFRRIYIFISGFLINLNSTKRISCGEEAGKSLYGKKSFDVIYNPIDIDSFCNVPDDIIISLKKQWGMPEKKAVLGMVGRLSVEKNHMLMLDVADLIKKQRLDFLFVVAGDGPLRKDLEQKIKERELENYVKLLGNIKEIPVFLKCINLLFMPSIYEGFPVSLIEAQASGVNAVISDSITKEADLKMGLIHPCALDASASVWLKIICEVLSNIKTIDIDRKTILEKLGFDSKVCAKRLVKLYEK